jgi:hypothetical protein
MKSSKAFVQGMIGAYSVPMLKTRRLIPLLTALALAACSTPETQIRNGLIHEGLSPPLAGCMATRMADRLSVFQLRRLAGIGKAQHARGIDELLHQLRALNDPKIVDVTATAAALCALGLH